MTATTPTGRAQIELVGVEGGSVPISWSSVREMQALAAQYGVPEGTWPVYECEDEAQVPLDDVCLRSRHLHAHLARLPSVIIENDYWLSRVRRLLDDGHILLVIA